MRYKRYYPKLNFLYKESMICNLNLTSAISYNFSTHNPLKILHQDIALKIAQRIKRKESKRIAANGR